jgi:hypothetical protein
VNLAPDTRPESGIDHLVSRDTTLACKRRTYDDGLVVALPVSRHMGLGPC